MTDPDPFGAVRQALAGYRVAAPAGPFLLDVAAQVTLDGAGYGVARIGPAGRQRWRVKHCALTVSSNTNEPTARVYLGAVGPGSFLAGSYSGANDSTDLDVDIPTGGLLLVEWDGGDPGARATVSLTGTYELR